MSHPGRIVFHFVTLSMLFLMAAVVATSADVRACIIAAALITHYFGWTAIGAASFGSFRKEQV